LGRHSPTTSGACTRRRPQKTERKTERLSGGACTRRHAPRRGGFKSPAWTNGGNPSFTCVHSPRRPPQARSRTVRAASFGPGTSAMIARSRPSPVKNVTRGVTGKLNIPPKTAALAGEGCADNQRRGRERERGEGGAACEQPGGGRPLSPSLLLSCVLAASSQCARGVLQGRSSRRPLSCFALLGWPRSPGTASLSASLV
jgi:hypothetical protein